MPAYVWITAAAAVAFVGLVAFGRRWLHSVWYSWTAAAHVIELTESEPVPAPEYGSMVLAEEREHTHPPGDPWLWLPAPPVDPEPWRQQIAHELSPEALANDDSGGWVSGECLPPDDPGPGDELPYPPSSPGPDQRLCGPEQPHEKPAGTESAGSGHPPSRWLAEQLAVLGAWSEWQQQKAAILA